MKKNYYCSEKRGKTHFLLNASENISWLVPRMLEYVLSVSLIKFPAVDLTSSTVSLKTFSMSLLIWFQCSLNTFSTRSNPILPFFAFSPNLCTLHSSTLLQNLPSVPHTLICASCLNTVLSGFTASGMYFTVSYTFMMFQKVRLQLRIVSVRVSRSTVDTSRT